jgi:hypothetical protein
LNASARRDSIAVVEARRNVSMPPRSIVASGPAASQRGRARPRPRVDRADVRHALVQDVRALAEDGELDAIPDEARRVTLQDEGMLRHPPDQLDEPPDCCG